MSITYIYPIDPRNPENPVEKTKNVADRPAAGAKTNAALPAQDETAADQRHCFVLIGHGLQRRPALVVTRKAEKEYGRKKAQRA